MKTPATLIQVAEEIWTADLMNQGLLWPVLEVGLHDDRVRREIIAVTFDHSGFHSCIKIREPRLLEPNLDYFHYLDGQMLALRQLHFMTQAHSRGGYS